MILGALDLLSSTLFAVKYERDVLASLGGPATFLAILAFACVIARRRSVTWAKSEPSWGRFEDGQSDEVLVLGVNHNEN